jgi:putative peptidoglycan lipid II flippase
MVAVKLPLLLACPMFLDDADVVLGLTAANSLSLAVGALIGQAWLRWRLGRVETRRSLITFRNCVVAAVPAVVAVAGLRSVTDLDGVSGAWLDLTFTTLIVGILMGLTLLLLRAPELTGVLRVPMLNRLVRNSHSR